MPFGMGLNTNSHGTYEARRKVPQHLEAAVARVSVRKMDIKPPWHPDAAWRQVATDNGWRVHAIGRRC
jgi:hypothetical protein